MRARLLLLVPLLACGARTELYVPLPRNDAGPDAEKKLDAAPDVVDEEFPPLDAAKPDAFTLDCPAETFVYVVSTDDSLMRFDPPSATFATIAKLSCPASPGSHPFSMAVDRKSVAYVEYDDGKLFAVSTQTGACSPTIFVPNVLPPFSNFGMGYATIGDGPDEELFIAADSPGTLGKIETQSTYQVLPVAQINPTIEFAELTGTGGGRLYAYYAFGYEGGSYVAELDKTTGKILGQDFMKDVDRGTGWAFAFWGGDFWLFTTPNGQATVKYDPATKTSEVVAHYSAAIVGAGVSTCAPQ